jgi:hypothetical protein
VILPTFQILLCPSEPFTAANSRFPNAVRSLIEIGLLDHLATLRQARRRVHLFKLEGTGSADCELPSPYPLEVMAATIAVVEDRLMVCGGYWSCQQCCQLV